MDKLDLILEQLKLVQSDVADIKGTQKQQADILKSHADLLTQLISIVGATNQKVSAVEAKVDAIDERTQRLDAAQARQEEALSALALRSIEQESTLRDLRRAR